MSEEKKSSAEQAADDIHEIIVKVGTAYDKVRVSIRDFFKTIADVVTGDDENEG